MAAQSPKTIVLRSSLLALTLFALLSTTGCEERTRLAAEILKIRRETLELQPELVKAQADLNAINKTYQALRSHPAIRTTGPDNLVKEVEELTERKNALELEVAELRKDLDAYRKTVAEPPAAP
jgi:hypothetical protein